MPRLILPGPNDRTTYDVTFEWTPVAGGSGYEIQVADNESFSGPIILDDSVADTVYAANLLVTEPLWWRVRAIDERGIPLPWSAVRSLQIIPPPLAAEVFAVTVMPNSVPGGEVTEGVVSLKTPAPRGGATVNLRSDGPNGILHPRRVIFPEGETAASFTIATPEVASETEVRVFAISRSDTQNAKFRLLPPRARPVLTAFAVNPAILSSGKSARGTVSLSGPAPPGTTIALASGDRSRVMVPSSVTLPAGVLTASFPIATAHTNTPGTVTVTASLDEITRAVTLNLGGAAAMGPLGAPPLAGAKMADDGHVDFSWGEVMGAASYTIEVGGVSRTVPAAGASLTVPPGVVWWRVRANDDHGSPGRWSRPGEFRLTPQTC